ncbi:CDP-glycerol glycerophosphotransferase family protein [Aeromicrobium sp. YIM 150415]|uniref:CDP-glycerol glycerophosphotransferase family protein n=1 Tax=Aeromicrobium sp. YIM 150415 TaxID=2803912 RepID=UPI0019650BFE|nr:CDP-glycerol glycerophosphotransferase family protein [Aeromicrobium sp. YIM 150415]MBM9461930.1 CDP-glycerol glycerophosphotransferase family protein [Aeromicrobium sp. YIM 150415]
MRRVTDRLRTAAAMTRKSARIAARPAERWRYSLHLLQRLIDADAWQRVSERRIGEVLVNRLLRAMTTSPDAVAPITRQLRRIGRKQAALDVVEGLWETKAQTSAEWSLACATTWHENQSAWRGDLALAHAMDLAPDWAPPFEAQARNRSQRGHLASAVEAAQRVIEIRSNPADTCYWSRFIGTELFKADRFQEALDYLEHGEPDGPDWAYWYRRAVCNERLGRHQQAAGCYSKAGEERLPGTAEELRIALLHYYQSAIPSTVTALESTPATSPSAANERLALLATALLRMEKPDEAVQHLRARDRQATSADVARIAALAEELAGNHDQAVDEYREALDRHPGLPLTHRLARALHAAGRGDEAVQVWTSSTTDVDTLDDLDAEADPHFADLSRLAAAQLREGDPNEAAPLLKRLAASASSVDNVQRLHIQLGHRLAALHDDEAALHAFLRASQHLAPHPSEAEETFAPLGPFERYAAAYETLPLEPNTVMYESFHGVRTACNPLAICQYLLRERPELHHVWAIQDGATIHRSLLDHPKISFVRMHSDGYRLQLATAGTLVNNNTLPRHFTRREGQLYLNTWHGVPWKTLGRDIVGDPYHYDNIARNMLQATHLAFPDQHTARIMLGTQDIDTLSTANLVIAGHPRMDLTLGMSVDDRDALRARLGVTGDQRTILYAPTWRGVNASPDTSIEPYLRAISALSQVSGAHLLLRVHYLISNKLDYRTLPANITVVPDDVDTNELLAVTDVLVGDYSSLLFDFAPLNRPIVNYVHDFEEYSSTRGLYFTLDEVPGVSCDNEADLRTEAQRAVDQADGCDWSQSATAHTWANEDGYATERVVKELFADRPSDLPSSAPNSGEVLIATASLYPNGITRSLRNLISSDADIAENSRLMVPKGALANRASQEGIAELHAAVDFTITVQHRCFTRRENLAWARLQEADQPITGGILEVLSTRMQRERRRLLGESRFAAVVDFDGYGLYHAALFGLGFPAETRRVSVLHNEFEKERTLRYPHLRSIGRLLSHFDALPSVSEPTCRLNQLELETEFSVPGELHVPMPNTINISEILSQSEEPLEDDLAEWLSRPGKHIVVVARLSIEKNQATLFDALNDLVAAGDSTLHLTLLGDGPSKAPLTRQAKELGIADRVFIAGHRSNPYPVMKRADAMLLPSLHEGQPMVLMEALTLGTPVVATNIPGPASLLQDGRFGLLVEPTRDGLTAALATIASEEVAPPEVFDPYVHQRSAVEAFKKIVHAETAPPTE